MIQEIDLMASEVWHYCRALVIRGMDMSRESLNINYLGSLCNSGFWALWPYYSYQGDFWTTSSDDEVKGSVFFKINTLYSLE